MEHWCYFCGGEQRGPVTFTDLRGLVVRRELRAHDQVWREGMPDWMPAVEVPGLYQVPPVMAIPVVATAIPLQSPYTASSVDVWPGEAESLDALSTATSTASSA